MAEFKILVIGDQNYSKPAVQAAILETLDYVVCPVRLETLPKDRDMSGARLIIFTGGDDVNPTTYGHQTYYSTCCNPHRDEVESEIFRYGIYNSIPMLGICRGSQFLWTCLGGTLLQDVDGHSGNHQSRNLLTGDLFVTNSTHHQAADSQSKRDSIQILAVADPKVSSSQVYYNIGDRSFKTYDHGLEVEAWVDESRMVLGIQWHPEMGGAPRSCVNTSIKFIRDFLILKEPKGGK